MNNKQENTKLNANKPSKLNLAKQLTMPLLAFGIGTSTPFLFWSNLENPSFHTHASIQDYLKSFSNKSDLITKKFLNEYQNEQTTSLKVIAASFQTNPNRTETQQELIQLASLSPQQLQDKVKSSVNFGNGFTGYRPVIDSSIEAIYTAISKQNLNKALEEADQLIKKFPNFELAHLLRGDILSLKSGRRIQQIGDIPKVPLYKNNHLVELREEAIARFKAVKDRPESNLLPSELVILDDDETYIILVDTSRSRLFLYENSFPHPRLVTDFYISQGKRGAVKTHEGDKRTPIGVYTITELLPKERLTDFYGPIALPIDYPNRWDRRLGKTGYGIWLHGMPESYVSRPPRDSEGCVVLANQDLLALNQFVNTGTTKVIISENLDFVPADVWQVQRRNMLRVVKNWKDDLESGVGKGLKHYAQNVLIDGKDLMTWQKDLNLNQRNFGTIQVENLNVFKYPFTDHDMMHVSFERSDSLNGNQRIEQFWKKIGTRWKIVQEDSVNL